MVKPSRQLSKNYYLNFVNRKLPDCVVQLDTCLPTGREYQISIVMEYFVYVLESEKDGRLYKGQTSNLTNRVQEHNSGKTKSTKGYVPWNLVYFEKFETREKAVLREKFLKTGIGREFLNKVLNK